MGHTHDDITAIERRRYEERMRQARRTERYLRKYSRSGMDYANYVWLKPSLWRRLWWAWVKGVRGWAR